MYSSWWHPRQANDAVASEPSIFSKNHDYNSFNRVTVNTYVPIFRGLDARGGRKLRTDIHTHTYIHTHTHTRDNYSNPRCMHACRVLNNNTQIAAIAPSPLTMHPQLWAELLTFEPKCTT